MYYLPTAVLQTLPEDIQKIIMTEGVTQEDMDAMTPEERGQLMADKGPDVAAPTVGTEAPDGASNLGEEKIDDSLKLPKPIRYGDENQFEDELMDDGHIKELPESKKNAITDMDDAAARSQALISRPEEKKMSMKKFAENKQKELES